VVCLRCGQRTGRAELDRRLRAANPGWDAAVSQLNPDGDAVLDDAAVAAFAIVDCAGCGGPLKPDVVFFGENVPPPRVEHCYRLTEAASTLLVLGSSLTVMSGYRFVRHAAARGIPVVIINQGETRGDRHATVRLDAPLGPALTALTEQIAGRTGLGGLGGGDGGAGAGGADGQGQRLDVVGAVVPLAVDEERGRARHP
jgi:NAD-dependent SIR2 family protein deacetylase